MNVFVYGTLKRGHGNHRLLKHATFLGEGIIEGFDMYNLGYYPCIVPSDDAGKAVVGELYEIDQEMLGGLDRLEGYPSFYDRVKTEVDLGTDKKEAWVYYHKEHPKRANPIPEGIWGSMS